MQTGKLNRLPQLGWIQRAAERRERRRSRRALDAKPAVPQTDVVMHPAEPEAEHDSVIDLEDQGSSFPS